MSRPILQLTRVLAVLTAVVVVVVLVKGRGSSKPQAEVPRNELIDEAPRAAGDVIALLDGLKPGDKLEAVTVLAIDAPSERVVRVHVGVEGMVFTIGISRAGSSAGKPPPVTTGRYELGYGNARGSGELPPGAMGNAAEALAERIRRRESEVPLPAGM
jgi:hypothetical protein